MFVNRIEPRSPALQADSLPAKSQGKPKNTGVGNLSLLQGIFPIQGLNPGLPHCGRILYQLSHSGSPRLLEWVTYPFSRGTSWPRNLTGVSCIAGRLWAPYFNEVCLLFNDLFVYPCKFNTVLIVGWNQLVFLKFVLLWNLFWLF